MEVAKIVYKYIYIPYRSKVGQPDAPQHNGLTNSETEMCMWKLGVLLREHGSVFSFIRVLIEDHAEAHKNLLK